MAARVSKTASLLIVTGTYAIAFAAAVATLRIIDDLHWHPLWQLALADVVATIVIYTFSVLFRNSSFYDAYWSVAPPAFLLFLLPLSGDTALSLRDVLVIAAVSVWAIRLTLNRARHWPGIHGQDWRYTMLKQNGGFTAFAADLFGIHLFPTFMVFMGCLPLYTALVSGQHATGLLDYAALAVCLLATLIELLADEQLHRFKQHSTDSGALMQSGIWSWSRHPNYFGEWLFWAGIFLFGIAADPGSWWTGIGMVLMLGMFLFASIPMMEKRLLAKRPHYADYKKKVSVFIPLPPRRRQ